MIPLSVDRPTCVNNLRHFAVSRTDQRSMSEVAEAMLEFRNGHDTAKQMNRRSRFGIAASQGL
jgi:hypothetical protein